MKAESRDKPQRSKTLLIRTRAHREKLESWGDQDDWAILQAWIDEHVSFSNSGTIFDRQVVARKLSSRVLAETRLHERLSRKEGS